MPSRQSSPVQGDAKPGGAPDVILFDTLLFFSPIRQYLRI